MLFPVDELFAYVLIDLAKAIAARPVPQPNPLPCDRWLARSCLQKACRRAEPELAQRALATLMRDDPRGVWRHLAIICAEDVGVGNVDLLAQIIAARRDTTWRRHFGGDWAVLAELVRQIAVSEHCQGACDLLMKSLNDPAHENMRMEALDADADILAPLIVDEGQTIEHRAIQALALGGGLAEGQRHSDGCAVFDIVAETGAGTHVTATCRAAWKLTRNPMLLLLPLLWQPWVKLVGYEIRSDPMQPVQMINGVPGYAVDQFTRIGNRVSRRLLAQDNDLQALLSEAGIVPAARSRAVGDLIFLVEGGLLANRVIWPLSHQLRLPYRWLPIAGMIPPQVIDQATAHIVAKGRQLAKVRRELLIRSLDE